MADIVPLQIDALQGHLESLKAEKHRLFQQLKMVLHEEDEKKRMKEMEQKQFVEFTVVVGHMTVTWYVIML